MTDKDEQDWPLRPLYGYQPSRPRTSRLAAGFVIACLGVVLADISLAPVAEGLVPRLSDVTIETVAGMGLLLVIIVPFAVKGWISCARQNWHLARRNEKLEKQVEKLLTEAEELRGELRERS